MSTAGTSGGGDATPTGARPRRPISGSSTSTGSPGAPNATPNNGAGTGSGTGPSAPEEERPDERLLECNICLDTAKDVVISLCGHLFCWPCLYQWLETRPNRQVCPVCKAAISKDKVIPLYGRGSAKQEDPRNKVPPRPAGQRTEPENTGGFPSFGFGDGFYMSFGIGAFPFGFITSSLNIGDPRPSPPPRGTTPFSEEQLLSRIFLWVAILFIVWLVMA